MITKITNMLTETIEVPKKRKEKLDALEVGGNFTIENSKRRAWATFISIIGSASDKRYAIHDVDGEISIWRLK